MRLLAIKSLAIFVTLGMTACSDPEVTQTDSRVTPVSQVTPPQIEKEPPPQIEKTPPAPPHYWAYREKDWYAYQHPDDGIKRNYDFMIVWYMGTFRPAGENIDEHVWRIAEHPTAPMSMLFFCRDDCSVIKRRFCSSSESSRDFGAGVSEASLMQAKESSVLWKIKEDVLANRLQRAQENNGTTIASAICGF